MESFNLTQNPKNNLLCFLCSTTCTAIINLGQNSEKSGSKPVLHPWNIARRGVITTGYILVIQKQWNSCFLWEQKHTEAKPLNVRGFSHWGPRHGFEHAWPPSQVRSISLNAAYRASPFEQVVWSMFCACSGTVCLMCESNRTKTLKWAHLILRPARPQRRIQEGRREGHCWQGHTVESTFVICLLLLMFWRHLRSWD